MDNTVINSRLCPYLNHVLVNRWAQPITFLSLSSLLIVFSFFSLAILVFDTQNARSNHTVRIVICAVRKNFTTRILTYCARGDFSHTRALLQVLLKTSGIISIERGLKSWQIRHSGLIESKFTTFLKIAEPREKSCYTIQNWCSIDEI